MVIPLLIFQTLSLFSFIYSNIIAYANIPTTGVWSFHTDPISCLTEQPNLCDMLVSSFISVPNSFTNFDIDPTAAQPITSTSLFQNFKKHHLNYMPNAEQRAIHDIKLHMSQSNPKLLRSIPTFTQLPFAKAIEVVNDIFINGDGNSFAERKTVIEDIPEVPLFIFAQNFSFSPSFTQFINGNNIEIEVFPCALTSSSITNTLSIEPTGTIIISTSTELATLPLSTTDVEINPSTSSLGLTVTTELPVPITSTPPPFTTIFPTDSSTLFNVSSNTSSELPPFQVP